MLAYGKLAFYSKVESLRLQPDSTTNMPWSIVYYIIPIFLVSLNIGVRHHQGNDRKLADLTNYDIATSTVTG